MESETPLTPLYYIAFSKDEKDYMKAVEIVESLEGGYNLEMFECYKYCKNENRNIQKKMHSSIS
jgi:hypothetical protein